MAQLAPGIEWLGETLPPTSLLRLVDRHRTALAGTIAFPGLVNSHDHLEFNCYAPTGHPPYRDFLEWSRDIQAERRLIDSVEAVPKPVRVQFGILKNLLWGVTAVADHGGLSLGSAATIAVLAPYQDLHSPELESPLKFLWRLGPAVAHLAEGVSAESRQRALRFLSHNLLRRPVVGIHGISLQDDDFAALSALVWCPGSNFFLFGRSADAAAAARRTRLLFGTDSTISAPGTLWDHLRQVRGILPDEVLFAALTIEASAFWRRAPTEDFVLARRVAAAPWDAFYALTPRDILVVAYAGEIVLLDESVAGEIPGAAELSPLAWSGCGKRVRLPLATMWRSIESAADPLVIVERFGGSVCAR
jgi:hypothetical protein